MDKKRNELTDIKQFGITLTVILAIFGTLHFIKHHIVPAQWFFGISIALFLVSISMPKMLKPVYVIFLKVAHALGWFNTRVILILIYYMLITPIALIMRIFGKDLLNRKIDDKAPSYWVKRPVLKPSNEQLEKQF